MDDNLPEHPRYHDWPGRDADEDADKRDHDAYLWEQADNQHDTEEED